MEKKDLYLSPQKVDMMLMEGKTTFGISRASADYAVKQFIKKLEASNAHFGGSLYISPPERWEALKKLIET